MAHSNGMPMSGVVGDAQMGFSETDSLVGVGIIFQPVEDGTLYVKRLKENQPAERSGLIQIGDCLCEINGIDVFRQPVAEVKKLLLGPPGTTVRLGFHRGTDPRAPLIQVALQRCMPGQQLVGVGIIFRSDATGALYVRQLQDKGPADLSGQVNIGDCIVEVDGIDIFRKPISTFTNLMLGPPGTVVTLGFKRVSSANVERVMLRRSIPPMSKTAQVDSSVVVYDNNIKLKRELQAAKEEHERLRSIMAEKEEKLREVETMYERGASSMGGQMNDEMQRLRTFDHWPHSESSHPGVTPAILAADGFHFAPTAQDPDTVICYFCDLQLGDWERADDCKAVHRKLSPNCPLVLGLPCGNHPRTTKAGAIDQKDQTPQQALEDVLSRKAALLQSITALEANLEDARRQIADSIQARRRLQQEAAAIALARSAEK